MSWQFSEVSAVPPPFLHSSTLSIHTYDFHHTKGEPWNLWRAAALKKRTHLLPPYNFLEYIIIYWGLDKTMIKHFPSEPRYPLGIPVNKKKRSKPDACCFGGAGSPTHKYIDLKFDAMLSIINNCCCATPRRTQKNKDIVSRIGLFIIKVKIIIKIF